MKSKFKNQQSKIFSMLAAAVLAVALSGSSYAQQITMATVSKSKVHIGLAGSGTVTIDWGDGSPSETYEIKTAHNDTGVVYGFTGELMPDNYNLIPDIYYHVYSGASICTVTITGNDIMYLDCSFNQLITLDVSKNTAMKYLNCDANQLTSFGTLHSNIGNKEISIRNNPGTAACNKSIAEDKGWTVNTNY
jgi:hypothetical protein